MVSFQFSVVSFQFSVVSGQLAVGSWQLAVGSEVPPREGEAPAEPWVLVRV